MTAQQVKQFFEDNVGGVSGVSLFYRNDMPTVHRRAGQDMTRRVWSHVSLCLAPLLLLLCLHHQGSGLVRFFDPDCVTKALQCLDMPFEGRPILVREVGVCACVCLSGGGA